MLYTKTESKKYVDMCKEFDEEFFTEERNDSKLFRYLYLLFYMYACKGDYFKKFEHFDGYAQFAATVVYLRFLKKYKKGERVKSVKNYADKTKKFLKIMYQNEEFHEIINPEVEGIDTTAISQRMHEAVQADYAIGLNADIEDILSRVSSIVKVVLKKTPYCNNEILMHRLYVSSMLTLVNNSTLPRATLKELKARRKVIDETKVLRALEKERTEAPVLWNLEPEKWSNFVRVIVNMTRKTLSSEINNAKQSYTLSDDVIDTILTSAYVECNTVEESEDDYE